MENLPNNIENEELSTVFSDPAEHNKKAVKTKNKRFLKAISLLFVVAIIIGVTFAVIKLIPEKQDEGVSSDNTLTILDYYDYDIKEITVKNKNGNFNIYSQLVETYDETTEETLSDTFWYLKGYDKDLTDSNTLCSIVDATVDIDAIREISKTEEECGLLNPVVTVSAIDNNGQSFTVKIGDKSPDNAGVYVKTSKSDKIYLVGDMLDEKLTFTDLDLASLDAQTPVKPDEKYKSYLSNGTLIAFDTIKISGKNFPKDVVLEMNKDENLSPYIPYYLTSPMNRTATNGDEIFSIFSQGFSVAGAYSYDVKETTIKKFGLNNPDFEITLKLDDYTYSYKFKKQDDENYAVIGDDSKNIKKVTSTDCGFLDSTTTDFYNSIVFITPIDGVNSVKFETEDATYDFNITLKEQGDSVNKYIIECNDKTYNSSYFQTFYQFLVSMECMDFETEKTDSESCLTITYSYNDKSQKPTVIRFVKINATRYQYSIDGVDMGKIGSTTYNKIHKNLKRILEGKQIVVN